MTQTPELPRQPGLGDVVRWHRQQKGWSQTDLVIKLGGVMDQGQISRLENGTLKTPRLEALLKLGEVLGVPPGQLLATSRFPGAVVLSPSLNDALSKLPVETFSVVEHLVRFASDTFDPDTLTQADRDAISDFCRRLSAH